MRSVAEQLERVLSIATPPQPVRVAISEAQGLLCAEEVVASAALPAFDQAAVDGYAVRSVDVAIAAEGHPVVLPVVGESEAGARAPHRLQPAQSVYVATRRAAHGGRRRRPALAHPGWRRPGVGDQTRGIGSIRAADRGGRAAR